MHDNNSFRFAWPEPSSFQPDMAAVVEGQANIFAPMYHQMNIAGPGLGDADAAPLQEIVHNDVWRALTHYLKYENKGCPFFLAGHSQGSMMLTDLMLEHWGSTGAEAQRIAALLPGWSLTPADLVTVKGGHFPEGVYHAFDDLLFFTNPKSSISERIKAFG